MMSEKTASLQLCPLAIAFYSFNVTPIYSSTVMLHPSSVIHCQHMKHLSAVYAAARTRRGSTWCSLFDARMIQLSKGPKKAFLVGSCTQPYSRFDTLRS